MYGKVFDGLQSGFAWVKSGIGACSVSVCTVAFALLCLADTVLAEGEAATINVQAPNINFSSVATTLINALTTAAVAGIGVGLSIWALLMVVRIFRRTAK